jgi:peptide/nickel transport system permease protein
MSDTSPAAAVAIPPARKRSSALLRFIRQKPLGTAGAVIVIGFCLVGIFAPALAPHDPFAMNSDKILTPPSWENPFGTDEFGRDVLTRVIVGSRISLMVGFASAGLGATIGAILGILGGYFGGKLDSVIQRTMDILLAFPMLVLALAMVTALGPSIVNVILALAIVVVPNSARVIRASALSVRERPFIEAAENLGYSKLRILVRHVLPNCVAPYIILVTAALATAILSEASLSFLGLGAPPPEPSWGAMLSGKTQTYMSEAPWLAIFPGLAISLVVFGFNFLGDALRDVLDPRLRLR